MSFLKISKILRPNVSLKKQTYLNLGCYKNHFLKLHIFAYFFFLEVKNRTTVTSKDK